MRRKGRTRYRRRSVQIQRLTVGVHHLKRRVVALRLDQPDQIHRRRLDLVCFRNRDRLRQFRVGETRVRGYADRAVGVLHLGLAVHLHIAIRRAVFDSVAHQADAFDSGFA